MNIMMQPQIMIITASNIKYPVKSRLFGLNKLCDYKALVRVEMAV